MMYNDVCTFSEAEEFIWEMIDKGYSADQLDEGCLGIGDWELLAPSEDMDNYRIREVFLNEWSSCQVIEVMEKK